MSITTRIDKFTQAVANDLDIRLSVDDSGSVTATAVEYIVRGEDGSVEWRAGTRRESAERVAAASPLAGLTIDSRELTVTIGIGKWESEKAKPLEDAEKELPNAPGVPKFTIGQRVYVNRSGNWWHGKWGTVVSIAVGAVGNSYTVKMDDENTTTAWAEDELKPESKPSTAKPPASGDWVYVSTRAAYGVITQIHEGYATVRLPNGNRHTYRTVPLDTLEKIPNTP